MSDYTRTPNYSLYKPVPNSDADVWGDHLNANADTLDAIIKTVENAAGVTSFNTRTGPVVLSNTDVVAVLPGASVAPLMDGAAAAGTAGTWAHGDHVHPSDTSKASLASATTSQLYGGSGAANVAAVVSLGTGLSMGAGGVLNAAPGGATLAVSATPPASPTPGAMWWDSTGGQMYLWYDDGNSQAWVPATNQGGANSNVGRNLVHNSLFNVAQRGAGAFTTSPAFTADRWQMAFAGGTFSVALNPANDTIRGQIGDEAAKAICSVTVAGTAGSGDYAILAQHIEDVRRLAGKTVTLSFWAAAGSGTPKLGVSIDQHFGNVGSPSPDANGVGQSVTVSTTYQRFSLIFILPSVAGKTLGTDGTDWTSLQFWFSSGSTNNTRAGNIGTQTAIFGIWGVQMELGPVATPLEKPDPQQDLAKCQRFYQTGVIGLGGYGGAGIGMQVSLPFPVPMRGVPTLTPTFTTQTNCGSSTLNTQGGAYYFPYTTVTAAGGYVLSGSFTASADL